MVKGVGLARLEGSVGTYAGGETVKPGGKCSGFGSTGLVS